MPNRDGLNATSIDGIPVTPPAVDGTIATYQAAGPAIAWTAPPSGGSTAYTIDVDRLVAAFSVNDSTYNETHGQLVMLDTAGTATGVKFAWPGGTALGPVRVGMWTYPAGVLVGTNASAVTAVAGVQTISFDVPVSVSAFRQYMIGVWRSDGAAHSTRYATTPGWLEAPNNSGGAPTVQWTGIPHSFAGAWFYAAGGSMPTTQITSEGYPVQLVFTVP